MCGHYLLSTRLHSQYDYNILCVNLSPLAEEGGEEESCQYCDGVDWLTVVLYPALYTALYTALYRAPVTC